MANFPNLLLRLDFFQKYERGLKVSEGDFM